MTQHTSEERDIGLAWFKLQELVYKNPYIPTSALRPSPKQIEMLAYEGEECMIGGAKMGGKSDALLMAALMYATVPGYSAIIIRRTYGDLVQDGGLVQRSKEWIGEKPLYPGLPGAIFREKTMAWEFPLPEGRMSTLRFGYFDHDADRDRYQGGAWQFCGADEATHLISSWYEFMFSCLRKSWWVCQHCQLPLRRENFMSQAFTHRKIGVCDKPEPMPMPTNHIGMSLADVPIRMFSGTNPGGPSHDYFKRRFVVRGAPKKFIPSKVADNPGMDQDDYIRQLNKLDPITRAQFRDGDWDAYHGGRIKAIWFREFWVDTDRNGRPVYKWTAADTEGILHANWPLCPPEGILVDKCFNFITCDPASSEGDKSGRGDKETDWDYTAIAVFAVTPTNEILILEVVRERIALENIVPRIGDLASAYNAMFVGVEDMAFQRGIIREGQRSLGVPVERLPTEGKSKLVRATPAIIRASEGQYLIPKDEPQGKHPWLSEFIGELVVFTGDDAVDSYDDQVDVFAWSSIALLRHGLLQPTIITPEGSEYNDEEVGIYMDSDISPNYRWETNNE